MMRRGEDVSFKRHTITSRQVDNELDQLRMFAPKSIKQKKV